MEMDLTTYMPAPVADSPDLYTCSRKEASFIQKKQPAFEADKLCEDADAVIFDANADGFSDLYVAGGGYHNYAPNDPLLQDRLYLNDGKGNFAKVNRCFTGNAGK